MSFAHTDTCNKDVSVKTAEEPSVQPTGTSPPASPLLVRNLCKTYEGSSEARP